jgi:hypothetical protein
MSEYVKDWGDFFLRDDTELRKDLECFADQVEAYSLFQRKPYGRVYVYGGNKKWAIEQAEKEVDQQRQYIQKNRLED